MDIVFRLLALPFHLAVAQFWMLLAIFSLGYLAVTWFDVHPVRIVFYGFIALAAGGLAVRASQFGSMPLAFGFMGAAVIGMYLLEPVFQTTLPKNPAYRISQAFPLDFHFEMRGNKAVGSAVNHSRDWFENALVECQGFYRDGNPVEQPWRKSIGGFSWLPPGETTGPRELFQRTYDAERYDLSRTRCRVAHADFREAPEALPTFTYSVLPDTGHVRFRVTNDTALTLTAMRFSCMQDNDFRVTFLTKPMFQAALDFKLEPDDTIELISERMSAEIRECLINSVDAL